MQEYFHIIVFLLLVFIDIVMVGKKNNASNNLKIVMFVIVLALYGGLRSPASMVDNYAADYALCSRLSFSDIFVRYSTREPVFCCFMKLLSMISPNEQLLFFVHACIVSIGFGLFVKRRSTDPLLSFIVFLALRDYSFCLAAMRQGFAVAIIMAIADKYLKEKKPLSFICSVILASLFHTSALLVLLLYPCYHRIKHTRRFLVFVAGASVFFSLFGGAFSLVVGSIPILNKYVTYIQAAYRQGGNQTTLIILTILVLVSVFLINNKDSEHEKEERSLSIGIGCGFCGVFYGAFTRTAFYFTEYSAILFPKALKIFKGYRSARFLLIVLLLIQYVVFGPGQGGINYRFFWVLS